jgi:hypothetical protein
VRNAVVGNEWRLQAERGRGGGDAGRGWMAAVVVDGKRRGQLRERSGGGEVSERASNRHATDK